MRIVIVGAGVVGTELAEQLSLEGHQVAVVDQDRRRLKELSDRLDVLGVCGNAGQPSVLERAGIREAEMVIAVTNVDEVNVIVGLIASRLGVAHRIARVRNREYLDPGSVLAPRELGLEQVINPDPAIVGSLTRMIEIPGAVDVATLAGGELLLLGFDIAADSPAAGRTPAELRAAGDLDAFLILDLMRGDELIVPKGSDRLLPGDNVHVLVAEATVPLVLPILQHRPRATRRAIILGASRIGLDFARAIVERVERLVLIEPDAEAAGAAALALAGATVLCGSGTDPTILQEAEVGRCDLFAALSDDDQHNMLAALLARKGGAGKAAVLVHQPQFVPVLDSLGIEIVINPRLVTVGEVLRYVRRGYVRSVTRLQRGRGELIELVAAAGSGAVAAPLKELRFPSGALVGALIRDENVQIPTGQTRIAPGDRVVVYALPPAIAGVERLFAARRLW